MYLDLVSDYAFKRIFGSEPNKDLLISLLNELFRGRKCIIDLSYEKNEHVGDNVELGTVIFDLMCTASDGEKFVIEVQRTAQLNLKKRMLYYSSKLISDQAPKGKRREWNYSITAVYIVVLMDGFTLSDPDESHAVLHDICLCNRDSGRVFYEELGFIYVQLRNFTKSDHELESDLDRWLYVLQNMSRLDKISTYLRKPIFEKLFKIAEYAQLNKEERAMYDRSLKQKWDAEAIRQYQEQQLLKATEESLKQGFEEGIKRGMEEGMEIGIQKGIEKGIQEGIEKGIEKGMEKGIEQGIEQERVRSEADKLKSALEFKKMGLATADIARGLGLTVEQVEQLK